MVLREGSSQWLLESSEPGFSDGALDSARLGERAVALAACQDGGVLVADTSNHRIRRLGGNLASIATIAGTGVKGATRLKRSLVNMLGQRDGAQLAATFSSPVAVLEAEGAVVVLEDGRKALASLGAGRKLIPAPCGSSSKARIGSVCPP